MFSEKFDLEQPSHQYTLKHTYYYQTVMGDKVVQYVYPVNTCLRCENYGTHKPYDTYGCNHLLSVESEFVDNGRCEGLHDRDGRRQPGDRQAQKKYCPEEGATGHKAESLWIGDKCEPYAL